MTDIVERLRQIAEEAADEIERLRSIIVQRSILAIEAADEIERLRAFIADRDKEIKIRWPLPVPLNEPAEADYAPVKGAKPAFEPPGTKRK